MIPNGNDSSRAKRTATLNDLRFNRQSSTNSSSPSSFPSPPSSTLSNLPAQSRDGTISSRFFPVTPSNTGTILVPDSSPINSSPERPSFHSTGHLWNADVAPHSNVARVNPWNYQPRSSTNDPLSTSSGFLPNGMGVHAPVRQVLVDERYSEGPPRKRMNRGASPAASQVDSPGSPAIQRPGQRRRLLSDSVDEITSSEDSLLETAAGPSRTRIVRGRSTASVEPTPAQTEDPFSDQKFVHFKMTMPMERPERVKNAWLASNQDVKKATELLADPKWVPNLPTSPSESGKVESIVEANKAQRLATREKGKQSMIYANRNALGPKPTVALSTPPVSKSTTATDLTALSPTTPLIRPRKRNQNVVHSDSEASEEEEERDYKRSRTENPNETKVLSFFNTKSSEALQELSGCSVEQARAITALRPFRSLEDLNSKLGQGKKKAGPAGVSPRLFEDCVDIFRGYSQVDRILEDCEDIGRDLRASIALWTPGSNHGSTDNTEEDDGAISLRSISSLEDQKSKSSLFSQPSLLSDTVQLKEYQLLGVNWLSLLYKKGLSCILADEMGLGKTIQVISFFAYLKEQGSKGPHLVVVPSSTLENWCREFARFAPSLSVQTYYAGKNDRIHLRQTLLETRRATNTKDDGWDVLVTTYNLAQGDGDRKFFRRIEWDCCVFDEGHVLKNFQSQRYQALLKVESKWRLLLTGTPLQNNLQELVSLMNFILPEQFAESLDNLRAIFKVKGDSKISLLAQERVSRAKKMMTPFVLRRRKDQVLKDLPKKFERIEWCDITPNQKTIYRDALQRSRKVVVEVDVVETTNGKGKKARGGKAKEKQYAENSSNVLMDLRKAALHPMLFRSLFGDELLNSITRQLLKEPDFQRRGALFDIVKEDMTVMTDAELQHLCGTYKTTRRFQQSPDCFLESGKVQTLMKLLESYRKQDRKVLIFSQFTQILDILEVILKQKDINYLVLKGSTPVDVRQSLVDEFTEDDSIPVFLLSTKAGGMGINLTAASVVIMFDQDFNPHNDRQAQDRAYRIGQKRDVDVIKLISRDTIEEDIFRLGQMKLALDEAVAGEDEKGESAPEREMRVSLMNVLRQQFEKETRDPSDVSIEPPS
ncbi:hypothetical protein K435DRAFT_966300 [Dendrothele bispora CBS 962.96]|uniref:DNA helicase n=1 Tax=Dendrothele bispora (strain CBS 962.96) TaxID=1314807 RepID=A0A4S8M1X1_DENBC|nr:hypothetical protein K435DRAFT_966300 [Dendrothele bispora CBS 962.96]